MNSLESATIHFQIQATTVNKGVRRLEYNWACHLAAITGTIMQVPYL